MFRRFPNGRSATWAEPCVSASPCSGPPEQGRLSRNPNRTRAIFAASSRRLWPEAKARGVSRATFDEAFRGVAPDAKIVALTKKQSEFVRPIWEYIDGAVSAQRLERGRQLASEWSETLAAVERTYGVPRSVVLGVWGMETNFGSFTGNDLYGSGARDPRLQPLSRRLLPGRAARRPADPAAGPYRPLEMLGSWAGAMGQTQFMPSSFLKYAVDGNRDGQRDIWNSVPDALASTANYLRQQGWQQGLALGLRGRIARRASISAISARASRAGRSSALRRMDGKPLPRSGEATLFLPGGASGPAFLLTDNFSVIKTYNSSDAYAMGVAHLGDRVLGGSPIQGDWPISQALLDKDQRQELQTQARVPRALYGRVRRQARIEDPGSGAELSAPARLGPRRLR